MARQLGVEKNTLRLYDNIGGGTIELYYRMPTTRERAEYANAAVTRKRNKILVNAGEARLTFGAKILTGFRPGDFLDADGRQFSSDATRPDYRADWKEMLCEHAADLVSLLAGYVFDGSAEIETDDNADGDPDGVVIDEDPEKNLK